MKIQSPRIITQLNISGSGIITGSFEVQGTTFLSGTISASGNFVPSVNELFDLGSSDLRWKDLYLSGSTIFLGATKLTTNETGDVEFKDVETNSLRKIRVEELEIGTGENRRNIKVDESGNIKFMDSQNSDRTLQGLGLSSIISSSQQLSFSDLAGMPAGMISSSNQIQLNSTTGTLDVDKGGTGQTTYSNGQLLIGNITGNTLTKGTLSAGTGISITNGPGVISISANNNGTVTSVTGTAPIVSSGGVTPTLSITAATTGAAGSMSSTDKTKLDGIITGATANSADATLLARGNHTGTQTASTIVDFDTSVKTKLNAENILSGSIFPFTGSATVSGSFAVNGTVIATAISGTFIGDGSGLTGVVLDVGNQTTIARDFTNVSTVTVVHSLGTLYPLVQVYDSFDEQIVPQTIKILNSGSVRVDFPIPLTGYVIVAKGGHIVSGTVEGTTLLNGFPGEFYLDYSNFTNTPALQLNQLQGTTFASADYTFPENLNIGGRITAREFHTELISSSVIFQSGSTKFGDTFDDTHSFTGSLEILGAITGSILATNGIVSGSDQVKSLLPVGTISGSSQLDNTTLTGMIITGSFNGDGSQLSGIQAGINTGKSIAMAIIFGA